MLPSAAPSSHTGLAAFSLSHSSSSPHLRTLTRSAIQPHVPLVCRY